MEFMEIVRYSVDRKCWRCFYERSPPTTSYAIMYIWRYRNIVHTAEEVTSFAKCMWHRYVDYDGDDVRHWGFVRVVTLNKKPISSSASALFVYINMSIIFYRYRKTWWCLNVYKSYQHSTPVFDSLSIVCCEILEQNRRPLIGSKRLCVAVACLAQLRRNNKCVSSSFACVCACDVFRISYHTQYAND